MREFQREGAWVVTHDGRRLLNFSSNDYLGLASHPDVLDATARAAARAGGATASRLIVGTDPAYGELEANLADFQRTEAALVFGSGYLANIGVISSLVGRGDAVFSDSLNHASIIDGCRLSRAAIHRYRHGDVEELESMLRGSSAERKLIVTETVFSMNGDVAPLAEIIELRKRYGAALLVDEAHADGVFGPHGEDMRTSSASRIRSISTLARSARRSARTARTSPAHRCGCAISSTRAAASCSRQGRPLP